jgi:hypothetical protein
VDLPRTEAGVIGRAMDTGSVVASEDDDAAGLAFARLSPGQRCVAVPLAVGGQVVAVLYADSGGDSGTRNPERSALELEPESTGLEHTHWSREPRALHVETLEILGLHASRCLEALTAMKAAQWLAAQGRIRPEPGSREDSDGADEYVAARRYARLLVSEIKLYHEPQVAAGRRDRDLATRLGREIARVHALYEERVPATVREHTDYVREELIRTLADGDASLIEG